MNQQTLKHTAFSCLSSSLLSNARDADERTLGAMHPPLSSAARSPAHLSLAGPENSYGYEDKQEAKGGLGIENSSSH